MYFATYKIVSTSCNIKAWKEYTTGYLRMSEMKLPSEIGEFAGIVEKRLTKQKWANGES